MLNKPAIQMFANPYVTNLFQTEMLDYGVQLLIHGTLVYRWLIQTCFASVNI